DAVEGQPGEHHLAADGAHVDQHAGAPRAHGRHDELGHGEGCEEIQFHEVAGFLDGHLPGGLVDAGAGVVDQDIDDAETLQGAPDHAAAVLVRGDVARSDEGIGAGGAAQALFIARGEGEAGSGSGELAGAGGADAFGGSGNEHHFAVNSHGIVLGCLTVAGAIPAGQTLGQTANFRQTAPEIRCQSRVCGVSPPNSSKTVKHPSHLRRMPWPRRNVIIVPWRRGSSRCSRCNSWSSRGSTFRCTFLKTGTRRWWATRYGTVRSSASCWPKRTGF